MKIRTSFLGKCKMQFSRIYLHHKVEYISTWIHEILCPKASNSLVNILNYSTSVITVSFLILTYYPNHHII